MLSTNLEVLPAVALVIPLPGLAIEIHLILTVVHLLMTMVCLRQVCLRSERLLQLQQRVHHTPFHLAIGLFLQYHNVKYFEIQYKS